MDWDRGPSCRPMSVLAVYGPVEGGPARASFLALDGPLQAALAAGTGPAADVFMAGDFNCTLPTPGVTTSFGGAVRAQCACRAVASPGGSCWTNGCMGVFG